MKAGLIARDGRRDVAEQSETRRVIVPVMPKLVHVGIPRAPEGRREIDQPGRHVRTRNDAFKNVDRLPERRGRELADEFERSGYGNGVLVCGHEKPRIDVERAQCARQRATDVAEPAGLHERMRLAGNVQDAVHGHWGSGGGGRRHGGLAVSQVVARELLAFLDRRLIESVHPEQLGECHRLGFEQDDELAERAGVRA